MERKSWAGELERNVEDKVLFICNLFEGTTRQETYFPQTKNWGKGGSLILTSISHSWGQRHVAFNKAILRWCLESMEQNLWSSLSLRMGQVHEKWPLGAWEGCYFLQFSFIISFLISNKVEAAKKARDPTTPGWGAPSSGPMDLLADGPWGLGKREGRCLNKSRVWHKRKWSTSRYIPKRSESRNLKRYCLPCSKQHYS